MSFKAPKNSEKISWTNHAIGKMMHYQLSEARVKRVLNCPQRKELGIAPGTIAVMQANSSKHSYEIWAMYQIIKSKSQDKKSLIWDKGKKIRVITAWRYPGRSPVNGPIPVPIEILEELGEIIN
jgi:hypothetical protein